MTNEELSYAVYQKMKEELQDFADNLKEQYPEAILKQASEYVVKKEIVSLMKETVLSAEQARALLSIDSPLDSVYRLYDGWSTDIPEDLEEAIFEKADKLVENNEEVSRTPVYEHPACHAEQFGKQDVYGRSQALNVQCRYAIERAITDFFKNNRLDPEAVRTVVDQFGIDRTTFVLVNTVINKNWDMRFSSENLALARSHFVSIDIYKGRDMRKQFVVDCHPGLTDLFFTILRKEYMPQQTQEQAPGRKKPLKVKPSIREKLKQPSPKKNAPNNSAHFKGQDR